MIGYFPDAVIRHVVDRDAFFLGGGQIDIVDAQPEPADGPAAGQLHEHIPRKLRVGHKNRVGVLGNGNDIVGIDALRHPIGWIEPRQRRLGRIERGKNTIGHSNNRAGHHKLRSHLGAASYDSDVCASIGQSPSLPTISMA